MERYRFWRRNKECENELRKKSKVKYYYQKIFRKYMLEKVYQIYIYYLEKIMWHIMLFNTI